jgi:hypothetical protein
MATPASLRARREPWRTPPAIADRITVAAGLMGENVNATGWACPVAHI